jgi:hypothetical protein
MGHMKNFLILHEQLIDDADRLLRLIDNPVFRDSAFIRGAVVPTLRRSGEVSTLRSTVRAAREEQRRRAALH